MTAGDADPPATSPPHFAEARATVTSVASVELSEPNACTIHVTAIVTDFAKRGHPTTLVAPRPRGGMAASGLGEGVDVRFTPSARPAGLPNAVGFVLLLPALVRLVLAGHADVVYVRAGSLSFLVNAVVRLLGRSHVVSEHNGWMEGELLALGRRPWLAWLAARAQLLDGRLAHQVLVVSPVIGQHLRGGGVPAEKIFVAGNGTDTRRLYPISREVALAKRGLPVERHYIGFLGTLAAWQGVEQAMRALPPLLARHPNAHMLIGGDGPERAALEALAQRLEVAACVTFAGHVSIAEANTFLNCFDVAILPKTAGIAALGMSPLKLRDYAATGRPVVAPDVPGIREFGDAGWIALHQPDQPADLAAVAADVLSDPRRREEMGNAARAYALRHFSWSRTGQVIADRLRTHGR